MNALELRAVWEALCIRAPDLNRTVVAIHCDNKSAVVYLLHMGGHSLHRIMELARSILLLSDCWYLRLQLCYLPGIANLAAAVLSHQKSVVEWLVLLQLIHKVFSLFKKW